MLVFYVYDTGSNRFVKFLEKGLSFKGDSANFFIFIFYNLYVWIQGLLCWVQDLPFAVSVMKGTHFKVDV